MFTLLHLKLVHFKKIVTTGEDNIYYVLSKIIFKKPVTEQ